MLETEHGDRVRFDSEVSERFALALLTVLAEGPIGDLLIELAAGRRRIVVKEHRSRAGWVVETEAVEKNWSAPEVLGWEHGLRYDDQGNPFAEYQRCEQIDGLTVRAAVLFARVAQIGVRALDEEWERARETAGLPPQAGRP